MSRVISRESVTRGNEATIHGRNHNVSVDGKNVSVCFRSTTGVYRMSFSQKRIEEEARKAYAKIVRRHVERVQHQETNPTDSIKTR